MEDARHSRPCSARRRHTSVEKIAFSSVLKSIKCIATCAFLLRNWEKTIASEWSTAMMNL